jgi:AhpD family alkylhydroperoxidase
MATLGLIEYQDAGPEVREIYDDIMATRGTDWINNFWKALANDPATLRRTWRSIKEIMAPGALDPLTKEMIYLAVSATNGCGYCIASHTAGARKAGMTDAMFAELMAVEGLLRFTVFSAFDASTLACSFMPSRTEKFRKMPRFAVVRPGPSRILRPALPSAPNAGRTKAAVLNHFARVWARGRLGSRRGLPIRSARSLLLPSRFIVCRWR